MAFKKKGPADDFRSIMDDAKKEEMLAVLIRNKDAFERVYEHLQPIHVKMIGSGHQLIWRTVTRFYASHESLPTKANLMADLHNALTENPESVNDEEKEKVDEFVEYAFNAEEHGGDLSRPGKHVDVALATCKLFMDEWIAHDARNRLVTDGMVPVNVVNFLDRQKEELEKLSGLTSTDLGLPFPEGWDKRAHAVLVTCGVPALDGFMGGGWRQPEVVLYMAPIGGGKSATCAHAVAGQIEYASTLWVAALARWQRRRKKNRKLKKPKRPVVVLIFTEGSKDDYRVRLLSNLAIVPWKRLGTMRTIADLDGSAKPGSVKSTDADEGTEYEKVEFAKTLRDGVPFENERERALDKAQLCNKHLVFVDCTDSDDSPQRIGKGGVPEIAAIVQAHFRQHKDTYPVAFYLDHVSALVDRMHESTARSQSEEERLDLIFKRLPRQCVDKLTKKWKVPMLLFHQLSGEANARAVTSRFHFADAAGSKSIAEYVDFVVVAGPADAAGMTKWDCTKHRREPPKPYLLVQIQGNFNRMIDRTDEFFIDTANRKILAKSEQDSRDKFGKAVAQGKGSAYMADDQTALEQ